MSIMDFSKDGSDSCLRPEAAAKRAMRIQREEAVIAKAEADIDAGLGIEDEHVEAWLDTLDHDPDAPLPGPAFR